MSGCGFVPIGSWSDAADLVAVISFPAVVAAVIVGAWQIISQLKGSRREAAFEVFLDFTERFRAVAELRRTLNSRFDAKDKSVNAEAIFNFYSQYWILQINQWEMFRAGLLPLDIYANWLCYTHDNIVGAFALHYFETAKKTKTLSSKEAFEEIAKRRMLRAQPEARSFFEALARLPHAWSPSCGFAIFEDPDFPSRREKVRDFLRAQRKQYRRSKVWKLD